MARGPSLRGSGSALGARSALPLRRLNTALAASAAAGLVAILVTAYLVDPTTASMDIYTKLLLRSPQAAWNSSFSLWGYPCFPGPGVNRFPRGANLKVQWDYIGGGYYYCEGLALYRSPKCGGRPYLTLRAPPMSAKLTVAQRKKVVTGRALTTAQVPMSVECKDLVPI